MRLHSFRTHFFFLWKPSPSKGHRKRARLDKLHILLKAKTPIPARLGGTMEDSTSLQVGQRKQPLGSTQMFHKGCLWFVASFRKFGLHSLWLPPSQVQEFMQVLEQFGRWSASVFSFIYVITHVGRRAVESIKSISVQAVFPANWAELRIQGKSTKS